VRTQLAEGLAGNAIENLVQRENCDASPAPEVRDLRPVAMDC
jgi:hypothetical protein